MKHVTTDSDLSITWSKHCLLISQNEMQFIHFEKSSGLYQVNHISHHADALRLEIFKSSWNRKVTIFWFSLIISSSKSLSCMQEDQTKTENVFCIPTSASRGPVPMAILP